MPSVILDIDGTLVDSNYHHTIAWARAFESQGLTVPLWKLHRHMGMGGKKLIDSVAGGRVEDETRRSLQEAESRLYSELIDEVRPVVGAGEAIGALRDAGWVVILASSARRSEVERYVDLLDAGALIAGSTDSGDVKSTKPEPDLIEAALDEVDSESGDNAVMVGDSVWDVEAASRAGVAAIAVLTGGFPENDLRNSGAIDVIDSVRELPGVLGSPSRKHSSG